MCRLREVPIVNVLIYCIALFVLLLFIWYWCCMGAKATGVVLHVQRIYYIYMYMLWINISNLHVASFHLFCVKWTFCEHCTTKDIEFYNLKPMQKEHRVLIGWINICGSWLSVLLVGSILFLLSGRFKRLGTNVMSSVSTKYIILCRYMSTCIRSEAFELGAHSALFGRSV